MTTKKLRPVHPGDILLHDFMQPLKLSSYKLGKELGVTAEMALRLSRYFGTTAQLWQNLQAQHDLEIASHTIGKKVERAIRSLPRPDPGSIAAVLPYIRCRSLTPSPVSPDLAIGSTRYPCDDTRAASYSAARPKEIHNAAACLNASEAAICHKTDLNAELWKSLAVIDRRL